MANVTTYLVPEGDITTKLRSAQRARVNRPNRVLSEMFISKTFTISAANAANTNTLPLFALPADTYFDDLEVEFSGWDSNVSATATADVTVFSNSTGTEVSNGKIMGIAAANSGAVVVERASKSGEHAAAGGALLGRDLSLKWLGLKMTAVQATAAILTIKFNLKVIKQKVAL